MPPPVIHRLAPAALLGLWQRPTTAADLWLLLPPAAAGAYRARLPAAPAERQAQWLAGRVLVHGLLAELAATNAIATPDFLLHNDPAGRPWLAGPGAALAPVVSLSHSGAWVAALLAPGGRVGVDVEQVRAKAQRLASKFLAPADLAAAQARAATAPDPAACFSRLWSAKETLYKLAGRRGLIFSTDLLLDDVAPAAAEAGATLVLDGRRTRHRVCYAEPAPGYVLTYCYEPFFSC